MVRRGPPRAAEVDAASCKVDPAAEELVDAEVGSAQVERAAPAASALGPADLGESLRTIGRILDAEEGRLVRIFRDQRRVAFEYVARGGGTKKVEMTRAELIKIQQSYYHERGGAGRNPQ